MREVGEGQGGGPERRIGSGSEEGRGREPWPRPCQSRKWGGGGRWGLFLPGLAEGTPPAGRDSP